ncbi:MAG: hypothetical protein LBH45_01815 [Campylobacteraceae bacterium]|jgi:CRISPR-associated protein Cmr3|nr:hypothetical protein [Campylobacteraceae bacterium]
MIWYELTPFDTLFFRGAIPFDANLPASDIFFPPPPSVIKGAIWTAGRQNFSKAPTVKISAILLKKDSNYYVQAPYSWFVEKSKEQEKDKKEIIVCAKEFQEKDAICSANTPIPWVEEDNVKNIGSEWIDITAMTNKQYKKEELFDCEDRTGIGIDYDKKSTEDGKLFNVRHIRLRQGVTIVIKIDDEYGLGENGILRLGGERRICHYKKIEKPQLPKIDNGKYFVLLAPVLCTEELLQKVFAAKTFVVSGWDMRDKKHKASQTWFCAGSVFTENISDQCVALSQ